MGELREIVEVGSVGRLFAVLAILFPLVTTGIGAFLGSRQNQTQKGLRTGLLFGLIAPANWILWLVYNAITDRLGLDTVANVVVNLALFALVGFGVGWGLRRWGARSDQNS